MSQERLTEITPESQDLINKVYPEADAGRLQEWLVGSTHGQSLIGELEKNTHDVKNAGISRLGILVEACANYHFRKDFDWDDRLSPDVRTELGMQILEITAKKALSGEVGEQTVKDKMAEIYNEGVGDVELAEGVSVFQIQEPAATELANVVEQVVADWVANDSLQMQLRTVNLKYEARGQAIKSANQRAEKAERELTEARAVKPATAEQVSWDQAAREKAGKIYEAQSDKVKNHIAAVLKRLDLIKDKQVGKQTEAPQDLEAVNKTLLERFVRLEEIDLKKIIEGGITNEAMGSLPEIIRLKLEERRKGQEQIYANNREKKAVKDYFTGHELKLVDKRGIDEVLQQKFKMARDLGIDALTQDQRVTMPTEFDEVAEVEVVLDKAGAVRETILSVASFAGFDKKPLLWDELTAVVKTQAEVGQFRLVKEYSGDEDQVGTFVVRFGESRIGRIEFDKDRIGKLIVKWEQLEAKTLLEASVYLVNLVEKVEGEGSELKGLKLTAAAEGGAEQPAGAAASVEPAPAEEALSPAKVELPAPVVEEPAAVEEMPPSSPPQPEEKPAGNGGREAAALVEPPAAELELPDWLKALQSAPSGAVQEAPAQTVEMAAAPLPKPEMPKAVQVNSVRGIAQELKTRNGTAEVKFGPQVLRSVVEATFARIINEQAGKGPKPTVNINEFRVDSGLQLAGNIQVAGRTIPVSLQIGPILNYVRHNVGDIPTIPLLFNAKQRDELLRTVEQRLQRVRDEIYLTIRDQMSMDVNLTNMIDPRIEGQDMIATFRGKENQGRQGLTF